MGKLVRDRIPEIIRASGRDPAVRLLGEDEYPPALLDKAVEEAQELRSATTAQERLAEAADVYEVLVAVAALSGASIEDVAALAAAKRAERGGFEGRIWLDG
ncbi:nucleoside triphosphate pyrophosphohydrolase [Kineococcus terrestris]|uniref:nucleoside triphosphate pyrophosphohydrolase n=1 Tax=Kineococcus terrestris TaxID=2044856 RepID=UPI0034DAF311